MKGYAVLNLKQYIGTTNTIIFFHKNVMCNHVLNSLSACIIYKTQKLTEYFSIQYGCCTLNNHSTVHTIQKYMLLSCTDRVYCVYGSCRMYSVQCTPIWL